MKETAAASGAIDPMMPVPARTVHRRVTGEIEEVLFEGRRATILLRNEAQLQPVTFFLEEGRWRLDLTIRTGSRQPVSTARSALNKDLSLQQATAGLRGTGPLIARIKTSLGTIRCELLAILVPRTVAHFIGLARGLRASRGHRPNGSLSEVWQRRRFYDGLKFHRTLPGLLIQSGDPTGRGTGGAGFLVRDGLHPDIRHDRAGTLSMATAGPNTASSQWLITLEPTPQLDDRQVAFGRCKDLGVVSRISNAKAGDVTVRQVIIERGW